MDACHIFLGRIWKSDRKSIHDGLTNTYIITYQGAKKVLHPLPPKIVPFLEKYLPNPPKITLLTLKLFESELFENDEMYLLITKEEHETLTAQNTIF